MSGVIDADGQQWEHCNHCGKWVEFEELGYAETSAEHPGGSDICVNCVDRLIQSKQLRFEDVTPGDSWVITESEAPFDLKQERRARLDARST